MARRKRTKITPGSGGPLQPMTPYQMLWRSQFATAVDEPTADSTTERHVYTVDVNFFDLDDRVRLYRDGREHAVATVPAAFPIAGGEIDVATSMWGVTRMHLVADGGERQLVPVRGSAEYWRARFGAQHPVASRVIGATAIAVLLVGLALIAPQLLEQITSVPFIAENVGSFVSPITLPAWLNSALAVAGVLATAERALTLKSHWLIDADTWWIDD